MAERQSTTRGRIGRNRLKVVAPRRAERDGFGRTSAIGRSKLEDVIAAERVRLSQAESVLVCLHAALLYSEEEDKRDPDFAGAAGIALSLVRRAVDSLDSAHLQRLFSEQSKNGARHSKNTVAERK